MLMRPRRLASGSSGGAGHRYWRAFLVSGSTSYVELGELVFEPNVSTGGVATTHAINASYPPENAFDGSSTTRWRTPLSNTTGAFLGYEYPGEVSVSAITMVTMTSTSYMPISYEVRSSADGTTWAVEWGADVSPPLTASETRTFPRP